MKIKILSVNTSLKKGTIKKPVKSIWLNDKGVDGDAHAGSWHRQVSLLAVESIETFSAEAGRSIAHGEFAENITTQGLLLHQLRPFDRLMNKSIELMVSQIGKKCHGDNCNIFKEVGNCVMPKEGIFAKVIEGGELTAGDELEIHPKVFRCKLITLSDRASAGEYADKSGPLLQSLIKAFFEELKYPVIFDAEILPDDAQLLKYAIETSVEEQFDLIFTTGGTGIGPRDITPETMREVMEKEIPGIMELIRIKYGQEKPNALLSRGVAGISAKTLMFALPGSPRAVNEYFAEIKKILYHSFLMLEGFDAH